MSQTVRDFYEGYNSITHEYESEHQSSGGVCVYSCRLYISCQLRARRALMLFKDAPLRTRRGLSPQIFYMYILTVDNAQFWFSTEHC